MTRSGARRNPPLSIDGAAPGYRPHDPHPGLAPVVGALAVPVEQLPVRKRVLARNVDDRHVGVEALGEAPLRPVDPEPPGDVCRKEGRHVGQRDLRRAPGCGAGNVAGGITSRVREFAANSVAMAALETAISGCATMAPSCTALYCQTLAAAPGEKLARLTTLERSSPVLLDR